MSAPLPTGLPDFGYSQQAASIASALTQHRNAKQHRERLLAEMFKLEAPTTYALQDFDRAQALGLFLTNLCRVGANITQEL